MDNALKLIDLIDRKLSNWDERSQFTIKGVSNLSRSDMERLKLYAEKYSKQGNFNGFMNPMGATKDVLDKYGLVSKDSFASMFR